MVHRKRWIIVVGAWLLFPAVSLFAAQDQPASGGSPTSGGESSSSKKSKHTPAQDLLIRGTVFNEHRLSLEGTTLRLHRAGEKKNRWQTVSNFRGEFAIRVPHGADYEVVAEHKGYATQTLEIGEKDGDKNLVFHMEPVQGGKR
jgi:hypothetical protein